MFNLSLKCHAMFSKSHKCAQTALFDDQEENFMAFWAIFNNWIANLAKMQLISGE